MSYSLETECVDCVKKDACIDQQVVYGAICGIHAIGSQRGHLGGGTINIQCSNLEKKPET